MQNIQFLYIEGCPNSDIAWSNLSIALKTLGIDTIPGKILIEDDLLADHYSFQGSPSIKINGVDLWASNQTEFHMGCRVYPTTEGFKGYPSIPMLIQQIKQIL
jgi:hypothetical protein